MEKFREHSSIHRIFRAFLDLLSELILADLIYVYLTTCCVVMFELKVFDSMQGNKESGSFPSKFNRNFIGNYDLTSEAILMTGRFVLGNKCVNQ